MLKKDLPEREREGDGKTEREREGGMNYSEEKGEREGAVLELNCEYEWQLQCSQTGLRFLSVSAAALLRGFVSRPILFMYFTFPSITADSSEVSEALIC